MICVSIFFDYCTGAKPWELRLTIRLHRYIFSKKVEDFLQIKAKIKCHL